ncbi:MAG TPA: alpha/beta hydrolase [Acidimicrobiia bacterium]
MSLAHGSVHLPDVDIHYVRQGHGTPLVLLHGWPEFWRVWRKVIEPLSRRFHVIAPDLRGFGASTKPDVPALEGYRLEDHVADLLGLADALELRRFGVVSHDVGAYVAQAFARAYPDRLAGLFFFDCPYPGIGQRWAEPDHLREIWYQSFHQLPWAADLVGSSRAACEIYFRHFLNHWAHAPEVFEKEDCDAWVDNFLKPGNLQGGFNWYVAASAARLEMIRHGPPELPPIELPVRVRWGADDPILKVEWADGLGRYFTDFDFAPVDGAGHFVAYERPELAVAEISDFFATWQ